MTYRDWDKAQSQTSYKRRYEASQQMLRLAMRENRVRDECLEIAKDALNWYAGDATICQEAIEALAKIKRCLAELEPEEKAG